MWPRTTPLDEQHKVLFRFIDKVNRDSPRGRVAGVRRHRSSQRRGRPRGRRSGRGSPRGLSDSRWALRSDVLTEPSRNGATIRSDMLDRSALAARGRRLEYVTIGWNCLEGIVAIIAGLFAGSVS